MNLSDGKLKRTVRQLSGLSAEKLNVCAIIVAAGSATRFGMSKQLYIIEGKTVLEHSLAAFDASVYIKSIVIAVKREELEAVRTLKGVNTCRKPVTLVCGGSTRQSSVLTAFENSDKDAQLVAIHDAARLLITTQDIDKTIEQAASHGAAAAASRITDTLKREKDGAIQSTVDREGLWAVHTPQVFTRDMYLVSLALAKRDGLEVTDDCALAEHAGFSIKLVDSFSARFKLTSPEDTRLIAALLKHRGEDKV